MKKTLYIQIDNNSLPEGCGEDVEVLDCRCINDFCSFVGDALVGDLKDENGYPYYRLFSPAGKLLLDFRNLDSESFETLLSGWYRVLADLLKNGNDGHEEIKLFLSDEFSDWFLRHEDKHYAVMGQLLKENSNFVLLNRKDLLDSIMSSITRQITNKCSILRDNIRAVIFSDEINIEQSYIINEIWSLEAFCDGIGHISFYNLSGWNRLFEEELQERIFNLDDCKAFKIDDFVLGEPIPLRLNHVEFNMNYKGGHIIISDGIFESISARKGTEAFQVLVSLLFPPRHRKIKFQSFSECHHLLNPLGFKIERTKLTINKEVPIAVQAQVLSEVGMVIAGSALSVLANLTGQIAYREALVKDAPDFICKLIFFSNKGMPGTADNLSWRRRMPDTLDEIAISIKRKA